MPLYQYFSYIWRSVLLVEETWVPGENYRPATSHWQTLSHNVSTVDNRKHNAWLLVNSLKIKRQIWIFKTYFWFICIRHYIHSTKSWLRWINLCGKQMQTIFSGRVSFMRSPENTPIEIMLWFEKQDNQKGNVPFNK